MSVVVYKDGVLAADTAAFVGDFYVTKKARKIVRTPAGVLVGHCGRWREGQRFVKWATDGFPPDAKPEGVEKPEEFGAIVVNPDGQVLQFDHNMISEDVSDQAVVCEGVGLEFCLALSTVGWGAEQIVAQAIEHCVWAGGEVISLRLDSAPESVEEVEIEEEDADEPTLWVDGDEPQETRRFLTDRGLGGPL